MQHYVAGDFWQRGYCDSPPLPAGAPASSPHGKPGRAKSARTIVEIDGEQFSVNDAAEAVALLDLAKKEAAAAAELARKRAEAATLKPVAKVLKDAEKALLVPNIVVPEELNDYAAQTISEIQALNASTLKDIEIATLLRKVERDRQDEEDILLLLL